MRGAKRREVGAKSETTIRDANITFAFSSQSASPDKTVQPLRSALDVIAEDGNSLRRILATLDVDRRGRVPAPDLVAAINGAPGSDPRGSILNAENADRLGEVRECEERSGDAPDSVAVSYYLLSRRRCSTSTTTAMSACTSSAGSWGWSLTAC